MDLRRIMIAILLGVALGCIGLYFVNPIRVEYCFDYKPGIKQSNSLEIHECNESKEYLEKKYAYLLQSLNYGIILTIRT